MKYTRQFIGSTEIDVSGINTKVYLYRNEEGNLERIIEDEEKYFPDGTTLEGFDGDMIIGKFSH